MEGRLTRAEGLGIRAALATLAASALISSTQLRATSYAPPIAFFEWNSVSLTPEATAQLIREVEWWIAEYRSYGSEIGWVCINGYADRSGPTAHNEVIAHRRAERVRDILSARRLLPRDITIRSFGEARNLRETEDGVRERLNRRVEVNLMRADASQANPRLGCR